MRFFTKIGLYFECDWYGLVYIDFLFLSAIEFALNLSFIETDLHSFIHDEFANNNMTMTYVEIVLDNGNALIPVAHFHTY